MLLVYASELHRKIAKSYGLHQEFIFPHTPEQNDVAESSIGTSKLECVWQHRFETYAEAKFVLLNESATTTRPDPIHASAFACRPQGENSKSAHPAQNPRGVTSSECLTPNCFEIE